MTTTGTPIGCVPPQPPARSNVRRPQTSAPTLCIAPPSTFALPSETWKVKCGFGDGTATSPPKNHPKTCSVPSCASAT
jgi:hypothetical protein